MNYGDAMIDLEKLKEAHELCQKHDRYYFKITYGASPEPHFDLYDYREGKPRVLWTCHIELIIKKLRELTQPQPKYEVGQEVFWLFDNEICKGKISGIEGYEQYLYKIKYKPNQFTWTEDVLFPSREALIEAQIEYWQNMKNQSEDNLEMAPKFEGEVKGFNHECEHEPEMNFGKDCRPRQLKYDYPLCTKCGKVYSAID